VRGATVVLVLSLTLAACGSNIDPEQAGLVRSGSGTSVAGGDDPLVDPGAASDPGAPDPGVGDPGGGAPSVPDTDSGGDPGGSDPAAPPTGGGDGGAPDTDEPGGGDESPPKSAEVSCDGLKNGTGITDSTITIGNTADISGPVPGLFTQAQQAVVAYVKYFNDTEQTICGRSLALDRYDSRTDAGADQQAYSKACSDTFAMVGAMSAFDSGGASTAEKCGLPDIRAIATTSQRSACSTCYAAQPAGPDEFENAVPDYVKRNTSSGGQRAAMLYINAGAAAESGKSQVRLMTKRGVKFVYVSAVDVAEFNYAPFVQAMKDKGVESVQFIAAEPQFARLAQTMQQQGFKPELLLLDPTAYSKQYTDPTGSAAVGTTVFTNFVPFEEASTNRELSLYLSYLEQSSPGAAPGFFGLFAWSSAKLFVEQATQLGGDLDRASLIAAMKKVSDWTAEGMHAPMPVGSKRITDCWRFIEWNGSAWKAQEGTKYQCNGTTS
jgi:ABC-type branched-subunit amino acid transport system substrate-binding protein